VLATENLAQIETSLCQLLYRFQYIYSTHNSTTNVHIQSAVQVSALALM